jgi:transcriptional regulator with XRE-family HTH domain
MLVAHRRRRGLSQIALSLDAGVSTRHLGFLEIGRSRPSADMVRRLSAVLGLLRTERDALLLAAGYAPEAAPTRLALQRSEGAAAFDAAMALGAAGSVAEAVTIAAAAFADHGVEHFISGIIRRRGDHYLVERDDVGRPAVGWLRYMHLRDYHDRDHLPAAAFARSRAFLWDDVLSDDMSKTQRRIIDEARDFRIETGFVLPVHQPDGSVRALSSWAERLDGGPAVRLSLGLVAGAYLDALDRSGVEQRLRRPDRLSHQHREVLLRIAEGDSGRLDRVSGEAPIHDLVAHAVAVMGMRCPVAAAGRAAALGLLE